MSLPASRGGELTAQSSVEALALALAEGGRGTASRRLSPAAALEKALRVADQIGITRLAEIGRFIDTGLHVYQATRTSLFLPTNVGMNTGSQGKGYTAEQGKISAIMESAEAFAAEPRGARLVQGSFRELSRVHAVLDPASLPHADDGTAAGHDEVMMWTPALALPLGREVLVPADLAYVCLFQSAYGHAVHYPTTSNGLGAGFDHLTATRQALNEVIERHYVRHLERLEVKVEALLGDGPIRPLLKQHGNAFLETFDIQLFAITAPALQVQLPFVFCMMGGAGRLSVGYGVGLDPVDAIRRAHSEAFQVLVTIVSAAREDLGHKTALFGGRGISAKELNARHARIWPRKRTLGFAEWAKRWPAPRSSDVRSQVRSLLGFLEKNGYPLVALADLSRVGVEANVVRAIVPGLLACDKYQGHAPRRWTLPALEAARYRQAPP